MIYCEKSEFGQISRSFALNIVAIRLKKPKNLIQIGFLSLRSVKFDRLLASATLTTKEARYVYFFTRRTLPPKK